MECSRNLSAANLRLGNAVCLQDPPISLFERNKWNEIIGMSGFFGEVILLLQQGMNCT